MISCIYASSTPPWLHFFVFLFTRSSNPFIPSIRLPQPLIHRFFHSLALYISGEQPETQLHLGTYQQSSDCRSYNLLYPLNILSQTSCRLSNVLWTLIKRLPVHQQQDQKKRGPSMQGPGRALPPPPPQAVAGTALAAATGTLSLAVLN